MKTLTKPGGTRQILAGILLFAATFIRADTPLPPTGACHGLDHCNAPPNAQVNTTRKANLDPNIKLHLETTPLSGSQKLGQEEC